VPLSDATLDDTLWLKNNLADLRGSTDLKIEERIDFDYEKRNFGQAPDVYIYEPYEDITEFNPVTYVEDDSLISWPRNVINLGVVDGQEYDGVIEPFVIRDSILEKIDLRYEGRTIRGSLVGGASERPWGSKEIEDSVFLTNPSKESAFLDAPDSMEDEGFPIVLQGYQDISQKPDQPHSEIDYHEIVYARIYAHNDSDMISALKNLNSSSCDRLTNPFEKRSSRGFYLPSLNGSIVFYDSFVVGELE
jgi:hypothetical protein